MLNMVQMSLLFESAPKEYLKALDYVNYVFTFIFFVEAVLKIIAYGKEVHRACLE